MPSLTWAHFLSTSVSGIRSNVVEGFDCESKAEFARFLGFARRSAVEVQSLLYTAFDLTYITEPQFKEYYEQARKTKALIGGLKRSFQPDTRDLAPGTLQIYASLY